MQLDEKDAAYLWDMLKAANAVGNFIKDIRFSDYQKNPMMQMAVERAVEILGEAARRISKEFKETHPEVPWAGIIAQRNMLAHEYDEIRLDKMWLVAKERIPDLIRLLKPLLPPK